MIRGVIGMFLAELGGVLWVPHADEEAFLFGVVGGQDPIFNHVICEVTAVAHSTRSATAWPM